MSSFPISALCPTPQSVPLGAWNVHTYAHPHTCASQHTCTRARMCMHPLRQEAALPERTPWPRKVRNPRRPRSRGWRCLGAGGRVSKSHCSVLRDTRPKGLVLGHAWSPPPALPGCCGASKDGPLTLVPASLGPLHRAHAYPGCTCTENMHLTAVGQ